MAASPLDRPALLDALIETAQEAGAAIVRVFNAGFAVESKADDSPVTVADRDAEAIILKALWALTPEIPVVAEEEAAAGRTPEVGRCFWLVDPLDGTREFVRRGSDFTVNIGLIEDGRPSLGVIFAPALERLFAGDAAEGRAWREDKGERRRLRVRAPPSALSVVASRSHPSAATERYLRGLPVGERVQIGSSLKLCLIAAGEADLYPRPSPTMEWDTAAGHAILLAAGGRVLGLDGAPLAYGKRDFLNPGFVATGPFDPPPLGPFVDGEAQEVC